MTAFLRFPLSREDMHISQLLMATKIGRDGITAIYISGKTRHTRANFWEYDRTDVWIFRQGQDALDSDAGGIKDSRANVCWPNDWPTSLPAAKRRKRIPRWEWGRGKKGGKEKKGDVESPWPCLFPNGFYALRAVVGGPSPSHDGDGRRQSLSRFPREWDNRNTGFCG